MSNFLKKVTVAEGQEERRYTLTFHEGYVVTVILYPQQKFDTVELELKFVAERASKFLDRALDRELNQFLDLDQIKVITL